MFNSVIIYINKISSYCIGLWGNSIEIGRYNFCNYCRARKPNVWFLKFSDSYMAIQNVEQSTHSNDCSLNWLSLCSLDLRWSHGWMHLMKRISSDYLPEYTYDHFRRSNYVKMSKEVLPQIGEKHLVNLVTSTANYNYRIWNLHKL